MAEHDPRSPSDRPTDSPLAPATPADVPGLIDRYRQRHSAWLAQADELIRLREQVRVTAEREAVEIIAAARRDVRRVVVDARRELLALTTQLQAAAESTSHSGTAALPPAGDIADPEAVPGALGETREHVRSARRDIRTVLDEARAELDALMAEATRPLPSGSGAEVVAFPSRAVPFNAVGGSGPAPEDDPDAQRPLPTMSSVIGSPLRNAFADPVLDPDLIDRTPDDEWLTTARLPPARTADASRMTPRPAPETPADTPDAAAAHGIAVDTGIASDPVFTAADGESDSRLGRGRLSLVIPIAAAAAVAALAGAFFLLRFDGRAAPSRVAVLASSAGAPHLRPALEASGPSAVPAASPPETVAAAVDTSLSLTIEARREAWIRTSIDGQAEEGRTFRAGETRQIVGASRVSIRAGDAGAVYVAIGGGRAAPLGASGAVLTRQFTASDRPAVDARPAPSPASSPASATLSAASTRPAQAAAGITATAGTTVQSSTAPPLAASAPSGPAAAGSVAPAAPGTQGSARTDLVQSGQQWLDAYQRRDREGMAALASEGAQVSDERSVSERFPWSQSGVRRDLDQVELELSGDTAIMTARMTERGDGAASSTFVSRVSQIWVRRAGRWQLTDVRLIAESRLNQLVR